jgi:hypothetical protein
MIPLILIFLLFLIFIVFFSHQFQINKVSVVGSQTISQKNIEDAIYQQTSQRRFFVFSQRNILFFDAKQAAKKISNEYTVANLRVKKGYFHTIVVKIEEKQPAIIWLSGADKFYIDSNGIVIEKIDDTNLVVNGNNGTEIIRPSANFSQYPIVIDQSNTPVNINQTVLDLGKLKFITELNRYLQLETQILVTEMITPTPVAKEIELVTKEGWKAYFRTDETVKSQVDLLLLVLNREVKDKSKLNYIDLRFGGKIYYQ